MYGYKGGEIIALVWDASTLLILLQAIIFCELGAVAHYFVEPGEDRSSFVGHLCLAVVVAVIEFSFIGDITNALIMSYITAGYAAPSIVYNLLARKTAAETPITPTPPVEDPNTLANK